jgi:hypothetical protein
VPQHFFPQHFIKARVRLILARSIRSFGTKQRHWANNANHACRYFLLTVKPRARAQTRFRDVTPSSGTKKPHRRKIVAFMQRLRKTCIHQVKRPFCIHHSPFRKRALEM